MCVCVSILIDRNIHDCAILRIRLKIIGEELSYCPLKFVIVRLNFYCILFFICVCLCIDSDRNIYDHDITIKKEDIIENIIGTFVLSIEICCLFKFLFTLHTSLHSCIFVYRLWWIVRYYDITWLKRNFYLRCTLFFICLCIISMHDITNTIKKEDIK